LCYWMQWDISCLISRKKVKNKNLSIQEDGKRLTTEELIQIIRETEDFFEVKCTNEVLLLLLKDARSEEARFHFVIQTDLQGRVAHENCRVVLCLRKNEDFFSTYIPEDESDFCDEKPKQLCSDHGSSCECQDLAVENFRLSHLKPINKTRSFQFTMIAMLSSRIQNQNKKFKNAELVQLLHAAEEQVGVKCVTEWFEYNLKVASGILSSLIYRSHTNLTPDERRKCNYFLSTYYISEDESVVCDEKPKQVCSDHGSSCESDKEGQHHHTVESAEKEEEEEEEEMFAYGEEDMCESKPLISRDEVGEKTTSHKKASWWSLFIR
jgi:hypothetical protein